jgi:hypothetical protein
MVSYPKVTGGSFSGLKRPKHEVDLRDFGLPSRCKRNLRSLRILRAQSGSFLSTFWDNLTVPSTRIRQSKNGADLTKINFLQVPTTRVSGALLWCAYSLNYAAKEYWRTFILIKYFPYEAFRHVWIRNAFLLNNECGGLADKQNPVDLSAVTRLPYFPVDNAHLIYTAHPVFSRSHELV